jgi:hypothetical protein
LTYKIIYINLQYHIYYIIMNYMVYFFVCYFLLKGLISIYYRIYINNLKVEDFLAIFEGTSLQTCPQL